MAFRVKHHQAKGTQAESTSSAEPNWAALITHDYGVTSSAGSITALKDKVSDTSTLGTSGLTTDATNSLLGIPTIRNATSGSGAYARFNVAPNSSTHPSILSTGIAWCALLKTDETTNGRGLAQQGTASAGMYWRSLASLHYSFSFMSFGAENMTFTQEELGWSFRVLSMSPGKDLILGSGRRQFVVKNSGLQGTGNTQFDLTRKLMLFNEYGSGSTTSPSTEGLRGSLAAFGIIDPTQIEQCRRYWAAKYSLSL